MGAPRAMDWLNYHHLLYFWTVVREGGVSKASKVLRLAQPTVSGQIKALENAFGEKLFQRQGRSLVLTDVGQVVFRYADEIFSLGRELQDTLKGRPVSRPRRLVVGVSDSVEKRVAHRLLAPALESDGVQLVVRRRGPIGWSPSSRRTAWTWCCRTRRRRRPCGRTAICWASAALGCSRGRRWRGSSLRDSPDRWMACRSSLRPKGRRCSGPWPTGSTRGGFGRGWWASSRTAR